jgi:hypothetical protein
MDVLKKPRLAIYFSFVPSVGTGFFFFRDWWKQKRGHKSKYPTFLVF